MVRAAHHYLQVAAELGVPGLFGLLAVFAEDLGLADLLGR
jgi:hypothetical protein